MKCRCSEGAAGVASPAIDPALWIPPGPGKLVPIHKVGGTGQMSPVMAMEVPVEVGDTGKLIFQYNSPSPSIPPGGKHCSDVRVHFLFDGQPVATTDWIGYPDRSPALPMRSRLYLLTDLTRGEHTLTLQPEGRVGGCNSGRLFAWDGTLLVFS